MPKKTFPVYVIDDDDSICRALKRLLSYAGFDVFTFSSAEEFDHARPGTKKGCLILDIRLPQMTGLDFYEKMCSAGTELPVIFITAYDEPKWKERAMKAGAVAFLRKPFDEKTLLDAVGLCRKRIEGKAKVIEDADFSALNSR